MSYISPNITNIISNGVQNLQAQMQAQQAQMQAQQQMLGQMPQVTEEVSNDPSDWAAGEQLRMFIWFMKMYHEEDIKGFKALRDIERSVERAEKDEEMRKYWERQQQAMQNGSLYTTTTATGTWSTTNAVNTISPYGRVSHAEEEPKKESFWRKLWYKL